MKRPPDRPVADVRPGSRAVRAELSDAAVVSRSWGMALATLVSRITGFIRIVLLAAILGAALSSAFTVANQLPTLIAALVLEATFTAIFVPVLARAERDDSDGGEAFVRRLVTLATTLLLVVAVLAVAGAPLLVRLMLGSHPQVNQELTTAFAYLLLPQVVFYGLSSVFMAILNNRNVFGPTAWAPVVNNVVAIATLVLYVLVPGELSVDPVHMGNAKLLVLGIGIPLGVVAQTAVLFVAIRAERISLRPLWGIDDRLKRFGTMAGAMVLYVLISQIGLVVVNRIASTAAASGPAIYNYTWLVLMLPFGIIGVTVLTVVMPRLSRNAAADNGPAVLADLSLATRLTMVTLIPIVAFMTVGGPAMGSALFAYGKFGEVDANYLGMAISLSAFTLIPYALVLLQLRVFYAREQPWTPIVIIIAITAVKIAASLAAPHLTDDKELVAGYLGLANGIGFLAGAILGHLLLHRALKPPRRTLLDLEVIRTILVTTAASLLAGLIAYVVDRLLGLRVLTEHGGGVGSLLRLLVLGLIMLPILGAVMLAARVPDAIAAWGAVKRRITRTPPVVATAVAALDRPQVRTPVTYPEHSNSYGTADATGKGPEVDDRPSGMPPADPTGDATTKIPRQAAGDFQPDVPAEVQVGTVAPAAPPADGGSEPAMESTADDDESHLIPGASIAGGRYRLLVFHGGPPGLQFWQALDTALDRQVALTFVDPDRTMTDAQVQEILSRTLKLSRVERPGIARVLDVANTGSGGLVVSEWIRGGSLKEVADTSPSAIGGARAVQSLAAAADAAHGQGVALSIDHPSRVRVSIEGDVALAFPATMPDATPEDDIRGIGAALYALLVDRWPLPEKGAPSGMQPAETDPAGVPLEPRALDGAIPFQISAAAARSVQAGGGIRSAPTLLNLLQQATAVADRTDLIEPVEPVGSLPSAADAAPDAEAAARRKRNLLIGVGVGAGILVIALIVLASVLSSIFGDVGGGLKGDQLGLNPSTSQTQDSAASGSTVKPVKVTVFSPGGGADNPDKADLAVSGGPGTGWPTDTYTDPNPFPNFKNGVGLLLQLPQPTTVGSVSLTVPSTGTQVQIRSASSANPTTLDDTTVLTQATSLQPGANTIQVNAKEPTTYLVVWISTMGTTDGKNKTEISGLTVKAAS
ncbi:integral membrane protein MviN [Mycolicibacterium rhodesiae JS60]|nr:integral membrane protein MviN [Mycolicibacterium rhodesiae JS60]